MAIHSSTIAWKIPWTGSLVGYSPWRRKESDMTEQLHFDFHTQMEEIINLISLSLVYVVSCSSLPPW